MGHNRGWAGRRGRAYRQRKNLVILEHRCLSARVWCKFVGLWQVTSVRTLCDPSLTAGSSEEVV